MGLDGCGMTYQPSWFCAEQSYCPQGPLCSTQSECIFNSVQLLRGLYHESVYRFHAHHQSGVQKLTLLLGLFIIIFKIIVIICGTERKYQNPKRCVVCVHYL